jgi:hypothetical protein
MMTSEELTRFRDWHKTFTDKLPSQQDVLGWITKDRQSQMTAIRPTTKRYPLQYYNLMGLQNGLFNVTPNVGEPAMPESMVSGLGMAPGTEAVEPFGTPGGNFGQQEGMLGSANFGMPPAVIAAIEGAVAKGFSFVPDGRGGYVPTPSTLIGLLNPSIPAIFGKAIIGGYQGANAPAISQADIEGVLGGMPSSEGGFGGGYDGGGYGMPGSEGVGGLW